MFFGLDGLIFQHLYLYHDDDTTSLVCVTLFYSKVHLLSFAMRYEGTTKKCDITTKFKGYLPDAEGDCNESTWKEVEGMPQVKR